MAMTAITAAVTWPQTVTKKEFEKYLRRDFYHCLHCGINDGTLVPQHRLGRGMGGSKVRDVPSNIVVLCSDFNSRIESNYVAAAKAKRMGWKLESWQDPKQEPVWDCISGEWYVLADDYTRKVYDANETNN